MPVDIEVRGARQFGDLARALRDAGDKDLRRELYRGIERAMKPMKEDVRQAAAAALPKSGGLSSEVVGRMRFTTRKRAGRNPGITLKASNKDIDIRSLNRGRLRHPVFGNRRVWVNQSVPAGWFEEGANRSADSVRREIVDVIETVEQQIVRSVK